MSMEYTLLETAREIRMAVEDEKTDQELYRVDPESRKEDSASITIPVEGAKVNVSSEIESIEVISTKEVSESTPESVVVKFANSEIVDLSGSGSSEIIITASKDLILE